MDRSSREKNSKSTDILNDKIKHLDLIDIFWMLHPGKTEYTFFSSSHGTFSRTHHILGIEQASTNLRVQNYLKHIF